MKKILLKFDLELIDDRELDDLVEGAQTKRRQNIQQSSQ